MRRARHLRVVAGSEAAGRAAVPRLEDALRCASLPDAGARLLLVRRLALGRMGRQASPQALACLIEARFAASGVQWVEGAQGDATGAEHVVFRSAWHARVALARRLLRGQACSAWYWPLAVAEYRAGAAAGDNVRAIARAVALSDEAPAALPAWVVLVVQGDGVQALASMVPAALGRALVERAGLHLPQEEDASAGAAPPWLECLLRAAGTRAAQPPRTASRTAQTLVDGSEPEGDVQSSRSEAPRTQAAANAQRFAHARAAETGSGAAAAFEQAVPLLLAPAFDATRDDVQSGPAQLPPELPSSAVECNALPTAFGGLLFLLPVLARLGLPNWAAGASADPRAWTCAVLGAALQRLHAPADDPMWRLIAPDALLPRVDAAAPASWQASSLAPPRGALSASLPQALVDAATSHDQAQVWLTAARRWLRRGAHIGLASLVHRPGRLDATPTHADVHFRLAATDLRVRRAGLDIDPGWLPWFGRVVAYHYDDACWPQEPDRTP